MIQTLCLRILMPLHANNYTHICEILPEYVVTNGGSLEISGRIWK